MVHRAVYEHFRGPIPEGLEIHHHCRNRVCANPDHMGILTHAHHMALPALAYNPKPRHDPTTVRPVCPHGEGISSKCLPCRQERNKRRWAAQKALKPLKPRQTHCKYGHPYKGGSAPCKECGRQRAQEKRDRAKAMNAPLIMERRRAVQEARAIVRSAVRQQAMAARLALAEARREARLTNPCPQGHPRTLENTYVTPSGHRQCRLCREAQLVKQRARAAGAPKRPHRLKTHCCHGHLLSGENLYISPKGARFCRECQRIKDRRRR